MKNSIIFIIIVLLVGGCRKQAEKYTSVYVFIDVTDTIFRKSNTYLNDIPLIIKKIGVDTLRGGFNGGEVKLYLLNDLSQTKSVTIKLRKGVSGLLGQNELDRMDEIKAFQRNLNNEIINLIKHIEFQKEHSKIYQNVCRELNTLNSVECEKKIAIIYSDMLENSSLLSFYGNTTKVDSYIKNIDPAIEDLSKDCSLPNLNDIDVHIVTVRTKGTDEKINQAEQFWTRLFKRKNCKVTFDAELNL